MKKLVLSIPGWPTINPVVTTGPGAPIPEPTFGGILTGLLNITIYIAGVLLIAWFVWGVFEYLFAGGDKEKLGKAQKRITFAILGFILVIISFAIYQYVQTIIPQQLPTTGVKPVTAPPTSTPAPTSSMLQQFIPTP